MKKNHQYALTASLILFLTFTICQAADKVHSGTMRKYSRYVLPARNTTRFHNAVSLKA